MVFVAAVLIVLPALGLSARRALRRSGTVAVGEMMG
jgi:hypothetical protein